MQINCSACVEKERFCLAFKLPFEYRAVSFHPVPRAMATGCFLRRKNIDESYQPKCHIIFKSKVKVLNFYFNFRTFLVNSWLLRKGSQQLFSLKNLLNFSGFSIKISQRIRVQGQECSHKLYVTPPSQWLETEAKVVKGRPNCSLLHANSLFLLDTSYPPFYNKTIP